MFLNFRNFLAGSNLWPWRPVPSGPEAPVVVEEVVLLHLAITVSKAAVEGVGIATRVEAVAVEDPAGVGATSEVVEVPLVMVVASTLGRDPLGPAATAVTTTPTPGVAMEELWTGGEKLQRSKCSRVTHITARF